MHREKSMLQHYTNEKNVQIVIALLKAHGIKRVVASPGATNVTFVASIQQDPFFEIYSCVDERSAAYMACGIALETGEPVVLTCTGATSSRNYFPGLTEAFYRHLPILAITATQYSGKIGSLVPQVIDRSQAPKDTVKTSIQVPSVTNEDEEWSCNLQVNRAIADLFRNGGGPVHINLMTTYSRDYSVVSLPEVRKIEYFDSVGDAPAVPQGNVAVFVGAHTRWSQELVNAVDSFCEKYGAVVFCDHTSNYHGKYRLNFALAACQSGGLESQYLPKLIVHIGMVSGNYPCYNLAKSATVWRVSPDGNFADTFRNLKCVFEMKELDFFRSYADRDQSYEKSGYFTRCSEYLEGIRNSIPELPLSNVWIASQTAHRIPENSVVHLGILNSLRSWNMFDFHDSVDEFSNTGGFGIDGCLSTLLGGSLAQPDRLHFAVLGDLAFFYDMNALGNRHVGKNLRILLINNGKGTEFRNFNHPANAFGDDADFYMAAGGHFGKQSRDLVRHYAEDLGFEYMTASTKEEYLARVDAFVDPKKSEHPIVFEVFTDSATESAALKTMMNLHATAQSALKGIVKGVIGQKGVSLLKKFSK